jgi:hypothetical protein
MLISIDFSFEHDLMFYFVFLLGFVLFHKIPLDG